MHFFPPPSPPPPPRLPPPPLTFILFLPFQTGTKDLWDSEEVKKRCLPPRQLPSFPCLVISIFFRLLQYCFFFLFFFLPLLCSFSSSSSSSFSVWYLTCLVSCSTPSLRVLLPCVCFPYSLFFISSCDVFFNFLYTLHSSWLRSSVVTQDITNLLFITASHSYSPYFHLNSLTSELPLSQLL